MSWGVNRRFVGSLLSVATIFLLGILVYGHTLHVPWYFDDMASIADNLVIRDLDQALHHLFLSGRGLAQLTFAINYRFGGLEVSGYHLVNISIHIITAAIVYMILGRVFRSAPWYSLLGALLFLLHPLQTQAVTYIVQRMTSLAGLFFFLSLYFYILFRERIEKRDGRFPFGQSFYYLMSLLCGITALLCKQNAAILPLALLLFDHYFLPQNQSDSFRQRLVVVLPFFLFPLWSAFQQVVLPSFQGAALSDLGSMVQLSTQQQVSVANYLVTEFSVLWLYLRLLFLPYGQLLDYSYPLATALLTWRNILALTGILLLLAGSFRWRRKFPLISFGLFWFFLALSVESTFIPLDPVFEHRLYVPMFGFVLVVIGLFQLFSRPYWGYLLLSFVIVTFAGLTWLRNDLWNDPVALVEDNLRSTPSNERMLVALSKSYMDIGRQDEALLLLQRALEVNPRFESAYLNISTIHFEKGDDAKALEMLRKGLALAPASDKLNNNLAIYYLRVGQIEKAKPSLDQAIKTNPQYPDAYVNYAIYHDLKEEYEQAISFYQKAIALSHQNAKAHINLASLYYRQQRLPEALHELKVAKEQDSQNVIALVNFSLISQQLGDKETAFSVLPQLRRVNHTLARELEIELNK